MNIKKIFLLLIIFLNININFFADKIFTTFDYKRITNIPIKFYPKENIQYSDITLKLESEYGKIYYLINSDFSKNEPKEYHNGIYLKGEKNRIVDYDITIILEKDDGRIELFTTTYRIDMIEKNKKYKIEEDLTFYTKNILKEEVETTIEYNFKDFFYGFYINKNKFEFPVKCQNQKEKFKHITIKEEINTRSEYLIGISYGNKYFWNTEVDTYFINLMDAIPPTFGSLYWGQIYKQKSKIKIKPFEKEDTVFYYYKEWHKDDLIFGPSIDLTSDWIKYTEPFEIISKFGDNGIVGLAAYSVGRNGKKSKITGPYFIKIMDIDNTFVQSFPEENKIYKRELLINNNSYYKKNIYDKLILKFNDYSKDDRFYFTFNSRFYSGKSDFLVCRDQYEFTNNDIEPVNIDFFYSNGERFYSVTLFNKEYNLPIIKNYKSNHIDLSTDSTIEFYMPEDFIIRYEITDNINKRLNVTENSSIFNGSIKITEQEGNETTYKIKFASFDKENNLTAESDYYYINIDKKFPEKEVASEGIDFSIFHNDTQILKLIPPEKDVKIYYRLNDNKEWTLYDEPLKFIPPDFGQYYVELYVKSMDRNGNERLNKDPFIIKFDKRAIFVDSTKKFSGNGTEDSPVNSLERAIILAKQKKLKLIYLKNEDINVSLQSKIDSDIIIQPYDIKNRINVNFITKIISKKEHKWFEITKNGYLEFRNIDFNIKSGSIFSSSNSSKIKIYNSNFNYLTNSNFNFFENKDGKIGLKYTSFYIDTTLDINFLKLEKSSLYLDKVDFKVNSNNINFIIDDNSSNIYLNSINIYLNNKGDSNFIISQHGNIEAKNIIYKQDGNFRISNIFQFENCNLKLEESDFILNGNTPFEIKICESKKSDIFITDSLFRIKRGFSVIGFNIYDGEITFHKSMLDTQNVFQYSYNFRIEKSKLNFLTSIIRNYNCEQAVSFVLNRAIIESVNNSIFNANIKGRAFNFWITEESKITSINSFYYFSETTNKNCFLFWNNERKDFLNISLVSNAITTNTILFKTVKDFEKKNYEENFEKDNIFYDFKDNFNLEEDYFFIPKVDSPLLQGGISQYNSIKIPEFDFFGKNRLIGGIGIDIGAVQISSY